MLPINLKIMCALAGATLPLFAIIFGDIINALGGSPTVEQLVHQVNKVLALHVLCEPGSDMPSSDLESVGEAVKYHDHDVLLHAQL